MKVEDATAYSFWLFQYMRRMDGFPPASFLLMPLNRVFDPEDDRAWHDSTTTLQEIEIGCFHYPKVWICQRAAEAVFPVGEHRTYEHTFEWIELHEERFPGRRPGNEVCVIDFTKDLPLIIKEISALWRREQSFLASLKSEGAEWGKVDFNAIERFMASGLRSLSDAPNSRAIGLWLWDRTNELGNVHGSIKQSIRELSFSFNLSLLGADNFEESDFHFFLRKTNECIQAAEVLPFTKRKKGTKNAE